jgi:hypothetical protein
MRKERVPLEHVTDPARLGRQIDPGRPIEEDTTIDHDSPGGRCDEAGQTLQRQRLAGSGRPEQDGDAAARRPPHVEPEAGHVQRDRDLQALAHVALAPRTFAATITRHDRAVRMPTRTSAVVSSPS